jgi:Tfp pilus assembly protein PilO
MAVKISFDYKKETNRYRYYYQRLQIFYQKPIVVVSSAVLFTMATIIFFAVFAIRPTLQTISELLKKIDDQEKVLILAEQKSSSLATAQQQLNASEPYLPTLFSAIPEEYAVQRLLKDLEGTAGKLGIPLANLRISSLEYPRPAGKENSIKELAFTISIDASYPSIKQFASDLVLLPRLITVESISINTPKDSSTNPQTVDNLKGDIKCRTYYLEKTRSIQ